MEFHDNISALQYHRKWLNISNYLAAQCLVVDGRGADGIAE